MKDRYFVLLTVAAAFAILGASFSIGYDAGTHATQSGQATEAYLVATNAFGVAELANQAEDEARADFEICHDDLEFYRTEMEQVFNDLETCLDGERAVVYVGECTFENLEDCLDTEKGAVYAD